MPTTMVDKTEAEQIADLRRRAGLPEDPGSLNNYLSMIDKLQFGPLNKATWVSIQDEGLDEEQNATNPKQWVMATLPISDSDREGLQKFLDEIIEKFNKFDILLKHQYKSRIVDLIDYDAGTVRLVKMINPA